ncbi:MAG: hypothetical protein IJ570_00020, partial [Prevotella sp.]|nr:hypothetical protein [Prevotella sp.]
MSRLGTNPNNSPETFEGKMLPNVEAPKPQDGGYVDLAGDGVHKIYMHRAQLEIYNWQARTTFICAARGFGKTSLLGVWLGKCFLGLPRQMGGFVGASAKQIYTRTMPNVLKVLNTLGFEEGQFYFRGQAPAKLRWPMPLAKPRVWENVIHFCTGYCEVMLSMAVRGSGNGLNLATLKGDEVKYFPWRRVKEELMPTLRGDFMPAAARKTEVKQWGFGTGDMNPFWLSQFWISDRGMTNAQCEWETDAAALQDESKLINDEIIELLSDLRFLEKTNPQLAVELAQNEVFLRKLHKARIASTAFFEYSSAENLSLLGEDFLRLQQRSLTDLQYRLTILCQPRGNASDGFYCNFSDLNLYESADCEGLVNDKYTTVINNKQALDAQHWPTSVSYETLQFDELERDGKTCLLDLDVDYNSPLCISIDAGARTNFMLVAQTRMYQGKPSIMLLKEFWVQAPVRLMGLAKQFAEYYRPYLRRNHNKNGGAQVIFYYTPTVKQGGATPYAVEQDSEDSRFDKVVIRELTNYGFTVTAAEFPVWRHERKYQLVNDLFSFTQTPAVFINKEATRCENLIAGLQNCAVVAGSFKKDKHLEKYQSEDGIAGNVLQRSDITDAFDDLVIGI